MTSGISNIYSHALTLLRQLEYLKDDATSCDFTIRAEGNSIQVHRSVLAANSDYFKALFSVGMVESSQGVVHIKDMDFNCVKLCVDYMYTGEAAVSMSNVRGVLQAADMWQFHELRHQCVLYLQKNVSVEYCLDVKSIAEDLSVSHLAIYAEQFAVENFDALIHTKGFKSLELCDVLDVMQKSREEIQILWQAAMSWIHFAMDERCLYQELFDFFDFKGRAFDFLFETVWKEPLVTKCEVYKEDIARELASVAKIKDLTKRNCFEILKIAKTYGSQQQQRSTLKYIADHVERIYEDDEFISLNVDDIQLIFQLCNWQLYPGKCWMTLRHWVKCQKKTERKHLPAIMTKCVLPRVSFHFIFNTLLQDDLIAQPPSIVSLMVSFLFKSMQRYSITYSNWLRLLKLLSISDSDTYTVKASEMLHSFIANNFKRIISETDFVKINETDFPTILRAIESAKDVEEEYFAGHGRLLVEYRRFTETEIWEAVRIWVMHDEKTRTPHVEKLIKLLTLEHFSFDFLFCTLLNDPLIQARAECRKLVVRALFAVSKRSDLTPENCFEMLEMLRLYQPQNAVIIRDRVLAFMKSKFSIIISIGKFSSLRWEDLLYLLQCPESNINLNEKWAVSIKWVKADAEIRKHHLSSVLEHMHLTILSPTFIDQYICTEKLIGESEECKTILEARLKSGN